MGIRTPNCQIRSLVLRVDLVGSRPIWPAHVGASSIQSDPDGSRRIVWMIKRMIKKIRRSTSRVMCSRLRTARLGPAVRVACLCGLRHGNALHEHPETCQAGRHRLPRTYEPRGPAGHLGPRARQPSGNPQPRSSLGGSRARNRVPSGAALGHRPMPGPSPRRRVLTPERPIGPPSQPPLGPVGSAFSCPSGQTLVLDGQQLASRAQQALRLRLV
jgi:hypothetical protein